MLENKTKPLSEDHCINCEAESYTSDQVNLAGDAFFVVGQFVGSLKFITLIELWEHQIDPLTMKICLLMLGFYGGKGGRFMKKFAQIFKKVNKNGSNFRHGAVWFSRSSLPPWASSYIFFSNTNRCPFALKLLTVIKSAAAGFGPRDDESLFRRDWHQPTLE